MKSTHEYRGWKIVVHSQSWKLPWVAFASRTIGIRISLFNAEGLTRDDALGAALRGIDSRLQMADS